METMKCMIVAYDKNRAIGANGDIPWLGKLPADMKHFRELTTGHAVIMGRKTYDSIGRPLPNRQNIVLTREDKAIDGVDVVHSLEAAYGAATSEKVFILGGAQIYEQALKDTDQVFATEIDTISDGDVFFPTLGDDWAETERENYSSDENNQFDYSFVTYTKQR